MYRSVVTGVGCQFQSSKRDQHVFRKKNPSGIPDVFFWTPWLKILIAKLHQMGFLDIGRLGRLSTCWGQLRCKSSGRAKPKVLSRKGRVTSLNSPIVSTERWLIQKNYTRVLVL